MEKKTLQKWKGLLNSLVIDEYEYLSIISNIDDYGRKRL
jgi:hypothetical protein